MYKHPHLNPYIHLHLHSHTHLYIRAPILHVWLIPLEELKHVIILFLVLMWPNYGLGGGTAGTGREGKRKAAVVLVLLAKDVVSLQINTEIGKL